MVAPTTFNTTLNDDDFASFVFTITNQLSQQFTIDECYEKVPYDASAPLLNPTLNTINSDCSNSGKCEAIHILAEGCVNNKTMIIQMDTGTASSLSSGDTISAARLAGIGALVQEIVPSQGVNTCYTLGGKTFTITSSQNNTTIGTNWPSAAYRYSIVTDCSDTYCGCKTGFGVNNTSSSQITLSNVKTCNGDVVTIILGGESTTTVTACINMNSFWQTVYSGGYSTQIQIALGTYNDCT
jgi:hypothetical protein